MSTALSPVSAPSRARRVLFGVGLVFITVGVGLFAYVGWQMFGTNTVARHQHEENLSALDEAWQEAPATDNDTRPDGDGPTVGSGKDETVEVVTEHGVIRSVLRIPRFGAAWRMPIIESVSEDALAVGVGHFRDSVDVGERGNYAVAAHRVTHGEPFRNMPSLLPGDRVMVETSAAVYTYVLDTSGTQYRVAFTDTWVLDDTPIEGLTNGKVITLLTCAEMFHTDDRLAVFGHLVSVDKK